MLKPPSSLRHQTLLLTAAGLATFLGADVIAVRSAYRLVQHARAEEQALATMGALDGVALELMEAGSAARAFEEATGNPEDRLEAERRGDALTPGLGQLDALTGDQPTLQPLVGEVERLAQRRLNLMRQIMDLRELSGVEAAAARIPESQQSLLEVQAAISRLRVAQRHLLEADNVADRAIARATLSGLALLGVLAVAVVLLTGLYLSRSISQPVHRLLRGLAEMERGILDQDLEDVGGVQELRELARAVQKTSLAALRARTEARESALAVESVLEQSRLLARRLETLARAEAELVRRITTDPVQLLQEIADRAREVAQADISSVGLGVHPGTALTPWVFSGVHPATIAQLKEEAPAAGHLVTAARLNRLVRLSQPPEDSGEPPPPANHPPMGPFMGLPLHQDGRVAGVLYVARTPGRAPFTDDEQRLMEVFAGQADGVLDNHRLYLSLQSSARSREDLMAVVSHDLKAPLNAIMLATHVIARLREKPERVDDTLRMIRTSVQNMTSLIDDLLHASAIEAGRFQVIPALTDVVACAREVVELLTPAAEQKGIRLVLEARAEETVPCDLARIRQVLSNLVGNAVKFTPANGRVTVTLERREADLLVRVQDDGPGIPSDDLAQVFDRFWRARNARKEGTGLGLYIAKGIVDAHGGRIWVESALGVGTTFSFCLPLPAEASPRLLALAPSAATP